VHLNLPLEEPLHADAATLAAVSAELAEERGEWAKESRQRAQAIEVQGSALEPLAAALALDPDQPGVVVAGPWRGRPQQWPAHRAALVRWQQRSGWPVLADGLSGLRGDPELEVVAGYDLLLESPPAALAPLQVLRLGSLPASRRLERWLAGLAARQVLVSEDDPRPLDPLGRLAGQSATGLAAWLAAWERGTAAAGSPSAAAHALAQAWRQAEAGVQRLLERELNPHPANASAWSEPALARSLARLLPPGLPLMLANSSPVRDWESFSAGTGPARPVLGFRGASGIDGTLSEACGLAEGLGACVLLCGDLALLHDSNGWLWRRQLRGRLTVVLIDNEGGGIFEQLPIRCPPGSGLDFERLFAMPQPVDPLALAAVHGIPAREVPEPAHLPGLLAWALEQPLSLLRVRTHRQRDAALRRRLRTMAGEPSGL
jgi:2-succinyl-5-enolpyruvyl-6-hydroxy-3-cyclohexene-1-carboxylate synthase